MMISFIIKIIFSNLLLFPLLGLIFFNFIEPNSIALFRVCSVIVVFIFNLFLIFLFKDKFTNQNDFKNFKFFLIVFLISSVFFFFRVLVIEPCGGWDAWAMWNAKAKDFTNLFLNEKPYKMFKETWAHPGYPTLIPLQIAFLSVNIGFFTEYVSYFLNYTYLILFFLMMMDIYSSSKNKNGVVNYIFVIPFSLIFLIHQSSDLYADYFLSILYTFIFYLYFKNKENLNSLNLTIIFFLSSCLFLIKNEGAFLFLSILFFLLLNHKINFLKFSFPALIGIILPLSLFLYYKINSPEFNPVPITIDHLKNSLTDFQRYKNVLFALIFFHGVVMYFTITILIYHFRKMKIHFLNYLFPLLIVHIIYNGIFLVTSSD
ncbi:MAG: hypothetical protein L6Q54_14795 [Leptospiraceae bacterium]|nr:hypothetical protein [Leptospiraceae bacterium]MCK6382502.1 hypothetical protein [Leptospiraceae bacterium]NUM42534.1 hypothetical protein [Leptospiraceae bacterium]